MQERQLPAHHRSCCRANDKECCWFQRLARQKQAVVVARTKRKQAVQVLRRRKLTSPVARDGVARYGYAAPLVEENATGGRKLRQCNRHTTTVSSKGRSTAGGIEKNTLVERFIKPMTRTKGPPNCEAAPTRDRERRHSPRRIMAAHRATMLPPPMSAGAEGAPPAQGGTTE